MLMELTIAQTFFFGLFVFISLLSLLWIPVEISFEDEDYDDRDDLL